MRLFIKLLKFFIPVALILSLAYFNLDNRTDISFGFFVFKNIPVFITIICSFCLGLLFSFPVAIASYISRRKKKVKCSEIEKMPKNKHEKKSKAEKAVSSVDVQSVSQSIPKPEEVNKITY